MVAARRRKTGLHLAGIYSDYSVNGRAGLDEVPRILLHGGTPVTDRKIIAPAACLLLRTPSVQPG